MLQGTPLHVAICGGGLGGLALALTLRKSLDPAQKHLTVDIYESSTKFAESGAGISAWKRTCMLFEELGLGDLLARRLVAPVEFRKSDTTEPSAFFTLLVEGGTIALSRAEMLNTLVKALDIDATPFINVHFSKKLVFYEQNANGVVLSFEGGATASADVLVGADGVGSATRKAMYADLARRVRDEDPERANELERLSIPTWTGTYAYRALVDLTKLPASTSLNKGSIWCGVGKHAVSYPISAAHLNVLFFANEPEGFGRPLSGPSALPATGAEIVELYKNFEPDLRAVAENVNEVSKFAISNIRGLPTYVDGRVVLLGDSAHAMSTHLAAGAGQAIEDAYLLGRLLAHPHTTRAVLPAALSIYDTVRRPLGHAAVEKSLRLGFLYEFHPDTIPKDVNLSRLAANDREELAKVAQSIQDIWKLHVVGNPQDEWARAEAMLIAL